MDIMDREFGKGWMSANASDLARIAIAFGNFDKRDLVLRLTQVSNGLRLINTRTVENVLAEMRAA